MVASADEVNQKNQEVTLSVYEQRVWTDLRLAFETSPSTGDARCVVGAGTPRLTWIALAPSDVAGATRLIWAPSTYLVNQRAASADGEELTYVFETGQVMQRRQKRVTVSCPMTFNKYPFDRQTCWLNFSTYSQSSDEVTLGTSADSLLDLNTFMASHPPASSSSTTTAPPRLEGGGGGVNGVLNTLGGKVSRGPAPF